MYNKRGGKVRLTFKLEVDQLWLGTKGGHTSSKFFKTFFFGMLCIHNCTT